MATITARLGATANFTGADTVRCKVNEISRDGVQMIVKNFNIEDATVIVELPGDTNAEQVPTELESTGVKTCIVGRKFSMKAIRVGGLPSGSYSITFIQL